MEKYTIIFLYNAQLCTVFSQNETTFIKFYIDQLQVGVWPRMGGVYLFWIKHLDFDKLTPAHFGGNAGGQRTI